MNSEANKNLIKKINEMSASIHKSTIRGGANWIVTSFGAGKVLTEIYEKEEKIKRLKIRIKKCFQ